MKILITGASGFVGTNLIPYLKEEGHSVHTLSLRNDKHLEIPSDTDVVVHLAGKAHDTQNTADPKAYFEVNTVLTEKLFTKFLSSEAQLFIYFSSVKAVADTVADRLFEDTSPNPKTPYGQSKWQAEEYIRSVHLPEGKRVFILRPCMIHGPGNKGNLNLLYSVVSKGIPWPLASFENERSFLSIANLNFAVKRILEDSNVPGGTYNLADDEPVSTNDLIRIISEVKGAKARLWRVPAGLILKLATLGDKVGLPLNSERLKKLTESYVVDNSKITQAVGRFPIRSREGLASTLKSF